MQHILNIAFDFDDDAVREKAASAVDHELESIIRQIVMDKIAPMESTYSWSPQKERNWQHFEYKLDRIVTDFIAENRDRIIDYAGNKLVKSVKSTKAWKEKVGEVLDES